MLSIITAILGFGSNFLPQVFKYFERKQDNDHELKMMEMQMKAASLEHAYKLEEIGAKADIEEMKVLHSPQQSFGVQMLDAGTQYAGTTWGKWLLTPAFNLYVLLDVLAGAVRPVITFGICGLYAAIKFAQFDAAKEVFTTNSAALLSIWTEQDFAILTLCLGYWFGARTYKAVFGGSTQDSKKA